MRAVLVVAIAALAAPALAQDPSWRTETHGGITVWRPTPSPPDPPRPIIVQEAPPPPTTIIVNQAPQTVPYYVPAPVVSPPYRPPHSRGRDHRQRRD